MKRDDKTQDIIAEVADASEFSFDAFASYATDPDGKLVRSVEDFVESFHRRASTPKDFNHELELCVDGRDFVFPKIDRGITPTRAIEQVIRGYMRQCRCLIVFGGPATRKHPWISREIMWWGEERPDGPIYFAYTHGTFPYPDKKNEFMPAALIKRGGPDNPAYFDLRNFHHDPDARQSIISKLSNRAVGVSKWLSKKFPFAVAQPSQASKHIPHRFLGYSSQHWKAVRPFEDEVIRLIAQLISDAGMGKFSPDKLTDRFLAAAQEVKRRRAKWATAWSILATVAALIGWAWWDRSQMISHVTTLAGEAQQAIDKGDYERAMRLALVGLPRKDRALWAPSWTDNEILALRSKLEGAAQLSAFVAQLTNSGPTSQRRGLTSATFSSDGRKILTASEAGTAEIWDSSFTEKIATCRASDVVKGNVGRVGVHKPNNLTWIRDSQFSKNGRRVVSVGPRGMAWIWDASGPNCGRVILLSGHQDDVRTGSFSPDGTQVVTTSDDDTVRIWNPNNGEQTYQFSLPGKSAPPDDYTTSAEYSPDGTKIVITRSDGLIAIADSATHEIQPLQERGAFALRASFSPDNNKVVVASDDGSAVIWDVRQRTKTPLPKQFLSVGDASFSPDGRLIATASADNIARIWDADLLELRFAFVGHRRSVSRVQFSPNGELLLTSSSDGTARIWDAVTNVVKAKIKAHQKQIKNIELSRNGGRLLSVSKDGNAIVWRVNNNYKMTQEKVFPPKLSFVTSASFDSEAENVVLAYSDGHVSVANLTNGQERPVAQFQSKGTLSVHFGASDTELVVVSDEDGSRPDANVVLNLSTGEQKPLKDGARLRSLDVATSHNWIAAGSEDGTVGVWDSQSGKRRFSSSQGANVLAVHFNPDQTQFVTAELGGSVKLYDTLTGKLIKELQGRGRDANAARYSNDGSRVVTASGDHTVRVWDVRSGAQIVRFEMPSTAQDAVFTFDGTHVIAALDDGSLMTLDVSWTTGQIDVASRVCREKLGTVATAGKEDDADTVPEDKNVCTPAPDQW
ncbi:PQQ-binding-like beta-propeller repeat protein [Agrobacterium rhizogenes]|nr:PQQ-binding-like beta-propeller repeat protein [Rhizobium rhizogenes]